MEKNYNSLRLPSNKRSLIERRMPQLMNNRENRNKQLEDRVYENLLNKREDFSNPLKIIESTQRGAEEGGLLGGIGGAAQGLGQFSMSPMGKRLIALGISGESPELSRYIASVADSEDERRFEEEEIRKKGMQRLYEFEKSSEQLAQEASLKGLQEKRKEEISEEKALKEEEKEEKRYIQKRETDLRKEFNSLNEDFRKVRDASNRIEIISGDESGSQTALGDVSLIFNYMKMLDPRSVVRESEYEVVEKAGGVPDLVYRWYQKALSGKKLSPKIRMDLLDASRKLYEAQRDTYDKESDHYSNIAEKEGLSFDKIVRKEDKENKRDKEKRLIQEPE